MVDDLLLVVDFQKSDEATMEAIREHQHRYSEICTNEEHSVIVSKANYVEGEDQDRYYDSSTDQIYDVDLLKQKITKVSPMEGSSLEQF